MNVSKIQGTDDMNFIRMDKPTFWFMKNNEARDREKVLEYLTKFGMIKEDKVLLTTYSGDWLGNTYIEKKVSYRCPKLSDIKLQPSTFQVDEYVGWEINCIKQVTEQDRFTVM